MNTYSQMSRQPLSFVLPVMGLMGAFIGLFIGPGFGSALIGIIFGSAVSVILAYGITATEYLRPTAVRLLLPVLLAALGFLLLGLIGSFLGALIGWFFGWFLYWIYEGGYRAKLHSYLTPNQVLWHYSFRVICGLIFIFLITPILVVIPLSFNAENFFTFTPEMLRFDPAGYSLKHYQDFFNNDEWQRSFWNSLIKIGRAHV